MFLSPQGTDYSVYARSQSEPALQYNTGSDCLSAHTENDPCKASKCNAV